ncbi:MAG TPA: sigma-70 family RNA polymerase sigma factor [Gaiellaceae bacterium]|nr:sigma-70 family RNA polymerase sigma factor [Gaiellaceae bacterium]
MAATERSQAASRAVDDLYRRHGSEVYRYALAVLGNPADAEDVTQTTFLNAYRSIEQGVRPRKPANWLLTIASNAIKQRFRQESSRPRHVELDDDVAGTSPDETGPTVGEVLTALSRIPPQQRQAIVLREFEGRSYKEIAAILDVTTSALETLLFRARRSLAEELEHQLSCTEAQLAVSKATDGRLGRKEKRRLRTHLDECPDCAHFARLQHRNRSALRGLLLVPVPLSLSLFKGLEGSATAATLPAASATAAGATAAVATSGMGGAGAAGGGFLASGVALKAAAVVTAATVAGGGAVVGASEVSQKGPGPTSPALVKRGKSAVAPGRDVSNGKAVGKASAPGQARALGGPAPGQVRRTTSPSSASRGKSTTAGANGRALGKASGQGQSRPRLAKKPATTGNSFSGRSGTAAKPKPVRQSAARGDRAAKTTPPATSNAGPSANATPNAGSNSGRSGK